MADDLAAMLHAAAAGVPHTITLPAPGPVAPSQPGGQAAFDAALSKVIDDLHALAGLADDPIDRDTVAQCFKALNGLQANAQRDQDAAMGGKVSPRQMRRAYGQ